MKEFRIRRADLSDVPRLAPLFDLYRQFYAEPPDAARAEAFLRERLQAGESTVFLAERESTGEALGFVQLFPSFSSVKASRIWVLNDLFVASAARGLGVGRALLEAAKQHALRTGARRLTLETVTENRVAWGLYEREGYVLADPSARFYTLELGETDR